MDSENGTPMRYNREALVARDYRFSSVFPDLSSMFPEFTVSEPDASVLLLSWTLSRRNCPAKLRVWVRRDELRTAGYQYILMRHGQQVIVWQRDNPGIDLDELRELRDLMLVPYNVYWVINVLNQLQLNCNYAGVLTYNAPRLNVDLVYENLSTSCFRGRHSEDGVVDGFWFEDRQGRRHAIVPTSSLAVFDVWTNGSVTRGVPWKRAQALIREWQGAA